jgi:GT2 family glycosyltransferase
MLDLSIVIVSYNAIDFLRLTLHAVSQACKNIEVEIFVVDNHSADHSAEMVKREFPACKVIANKHNPGFAIANNQAIKMAKGRYILVLNPDTIVAEDTLEKAIAFMDRNSSIGGLGIKMLDGSGIFLPESKRGIPSPWVAFCKMSGLSSFFPKSKLFSEYHKGYLPPDKNHPTEIMAGAFMLLRKEVLNKVGLLDEDYFMYGEDIDLSYRIVKAGYQNYYYSDSAIIHFKGECTIKDKIYHDRFYKAMILFAKKHFHKSYGAILHILIYTGIRFARLLSGFSTIEKPEKCPYPNYILLHEHLPAAPILQKLKNNSLHTTIAQLVHLNKGIIIFPLGKIHYKTMIDIMEKYQDKFQYRFLIEDKEIIVGSDKKDIKGQIKHL